MRKKHLFSVLLILTTLLLTVSCGGNKKDKSGEQATASFIEVKIEGMTCTACEQTIQRKVGKLEGIKSVRATFTDGRAIVEYFPSLVDTLKIRETITSSGYTVKSFTPANPL
ncbi:MAG: heavy-metal-associated domain-containing protein [Bacteroidetes bacterium]|nr:heavy-metal-associated domain-containing protein [Bacteroidota bacterium]